MLILVTGPPGVGKTTLITSVVNRLKSKQNLSISGFYSEEIRGNSNSTESSVSLSSSSAASYTGRIGFKMVDINNPNVQCKLASSESSSEIQSQNLNDMPKVGKYSVHVQEMEEFCCNRFDAFEEQVTMSKSSKSKTHLFLLDEVGKMELFSDRFRQSARRLLMNGYYSNSSSANSVQNQNQGTSTGSGNTNMIIISTICQNLPKDPLLKELRNLSGDDKVWHIEVTRGNRNNLKDEIFDWISETWYKESDLDSIKSLAQQQGQNGAITSNGTNTSNCSGSTVATEPAAVVDTSLMPETEKKMKSKRWGKNPDRK